jgi:spermidine/putrescine transport system substrate-binding protein
MTINRLTRRLLGASVAAMALMGSYAAASAADLNALVWCDHSDPNLLKPFEDATGIKVNVKEFEGTGAGLAIVEQSQPGDWDVMVIDTVDVRRGVERNLFDALPDEERRGPKGRKLAKGDVRAKLVERATAAMTAW